MKMASSPRVMIDVREEIETAPIRPYHYFLAWLVAMIVFFDGYDTFNAAYVIHYVILPWHLTSSEAGLLVSSGLFGFTISAIFQGKFSDRYGRRKTLLAALWIASIFSFATAALAHSFLTFCAYRFLTGIGLGILLPVSVTYINEFAPRRMKHAFSTWGWGLGFSAGGIAASMVGVFLTPKFGWQSLFYVASLSVLLALFCHSVLPESPQFSAVLGDTRGIAGILARLNPSGAPKYRATGVRFVSPESHDNLASMSLLLSRHYRRTTLSIWGSAVFVMFGIYGMTGWIPTAMMQRGETFAASFGFGALILGMNFVGTLACGYFAGHFGKGPGALALWWIAGALSMGMLAFVNIHELNVAGLAAGGFFILGGQGALNNLTAHWYDTEVRGTAVGMMLGLGRLGGILGPFVTGVLQQATRGSSVLFFAIGLAALVGAGAILFARPSPSQGIAVILEST
jgi:AAHS family 4-hydroxybenzoate transporter-like MFS transporter